MHNSVLKLPRHHCVSRRGEVKKKLSYGPIQLEAMIDQNTTIDHQLTFWDQKGSSVIRGNLIAVPIENSFMHVVPVYLTAEGTNFPQL